MRGIRGSFALALAVSLVAPATVLADSTAQTFEYHLEVPNVSAAPNGDTIAVTGTGEFSVHPKAATGAGTFTHTFAAGGSVSGTWTATELLEFQPYGCGILVNVPGGPIDIPDNLCGGVLRLRVQLTAGSMQLPGILTVFCIIGPNPPASHDDPTEEGITLLVPGILNFTRIVSGMNVYIQTD